MVVCLAIVKTRQRLKKLLSWDSNQAATSLSKVDLDWDKKLNELLDQNPVLESGRTYHTIKINNVEVWTSNYPYAYGAAYDENHQRGGLPSIGTRQRLKAMLSSKRVGYRSEICTGGPDLTSVALYFQSHPLTELAN